MIENKKVNIFFASSPYNVFLEFSLAIERKEQSSDINILFIVDDFNNVEQFKNILKSSCSGSDNNNIFDHIYILKGLYGSKINTHSYIFKLKRLASLLYNAAKIKKNLKNIVGSQMVQAIYAVHPSSFEVQFTYFSKFCDKAKLFCVEDGITIYGDTNMRNLNHKWIALKKHVYKFLFNSRFTHHDFSFLFPYIDACYVTYPEFVKNDFLLGKGVLAIQKDGYRNLIFKDLAKQFMKDSLLDIFKNNNCALFVLNLSERMNAENRKIYIEWLKNKFEKLKKEDYKIVIKYHPRETKSYLAGIDDLVVINNNMALEFLYVDKEIKIKKIYGTTSTALFTAKWLRNDLEIICFEKSMPGYKTRNVFKNYIDILEKIGVCFE